MKFCTCHASTVFMVCGKFCVDHVRRISNTGKSEMQGQFLWNFKSTSEAWQVGPFWQDTLEMKHPLMWVSITQHQLIPSINQTLLISMGSIPFSWYQSGFFLHMDHSQMVNMLAIAVGGKRCLWDSEITDLKPCSNLQSNLLIIDIYPSTSAWIHVLMCSPYKVLSYLLLKSAGLFI